MAVYSTNQNRQFYVAGTYQASTLSNEKDISVKVKDNEMYFLYKGADTVLKSDRIPLKNLDYIKVIAAADMVDLMKSVKVTLASSINSGNPIAGQDYLLRIAFRQFYGMSDEDQYFKDVAVHATAAMEADKKEFYKAMVAALNKAFSREVGATASGNPYLTFGAGTSGSEDGIYITEKPQEWTLGTQAQERVYFDVYPTTVYTGGDDVIWGTVTDISATTNSTVTNGKKIADLEYFCMGERGDQYRMQGWPNYIPTKYLVDPTSQYHVLEIHYAFTDTGVNSYRSEKDITIVDATQAQMIALVKAIQTATGLTVAKSTTAAGWTWT